jgi:hypothetical protein
MSNADRNFVLQQGLEPPEGPACTRLTGALLFQPRVVGLMVLAGILTQQPVVFAVLAALLWWSALLPRLNPFDAIYNLVFASGGLGLPPARPPRRFAQGMAGTFAAAIAFALFAHAALTAWVLQGLFLAAILALALGRFCLGSFFYFLVRGRRAFAVGTLPWGRGV